MVWSLRNWVLLTCRNPTSDVTPRQTNGYDCGVFVLMFAEYEARNAKFNFTQQDMKACRARLVTDLATQQVASP